MQRYLRPVSFDRNPKTAARLVVRCFGVLRNDVCGGIVSFAVTVSEAAETEPASPLIESLTATSQMPFGFTPANAGVTSVSEGAEATLGPPRPDVR